MRPRRNRYGRAIAGLCALAVSCGLAPGEPKDLRNSAANPASLRERVPPPPPEPQPPAVEAQTSPTGEVTYNDVVKAWLDALGELFRKGRTAQERVKILSKAAEVTRKYIDQLGEAMSKMFERDADDGAGQPQEEWRAPPKPPEDRSIGGKIRHLIEGGGKR